MPDFLTPPAAVCCLVVCGALIASILALATDDWLHIKQTATSTELTSGLTTTVTTAVRYGIWRKCQVRHNGVDVVVNGEAKSKHCYELIDDGTTAWVMASAVMMIYTTFAILLVLILWVVFTFFITKKGQACLKIFTIVLACSAILFNFIVIVGWIAERKDTAKDAFTEAANITYDYSYRLEWAWGMVILALLLEIIAVVLMILSKARD